MNLHAIVAGAIGAINPFIPATISISTGYVVNADHTRTPSYAITANVPVQVQALTFRDIQQVDGLNLNGTRRAIYINGHVDGLVRVDNKGGDLIKLSDGTVWLVAMVLEAWPDWTKVAVTLQNNA